jgi:hypothetical protein
VIFVDTGTHIFSLIEDLTLPECVEVLVQDTSDLQPLVIVLAIAEASAELAGSEADGMPQRRADETFAGTADHTPAEAPAGIRKADGGATPAKGNR